VESVKASSLFEPSKVSTWPYRRRRKAHVDFGHRFLKGFKVDAKTTLVTTNEKAFFNATPPFRASSSLSPSPSHGSRREERRLAVRSLGDALTAPPTEELRLPQSMLCGSEGRFWLQNE